MLIEISGMPCTGKTTNKNYYEQIYNAKLIDKWTIQKRLKINTSSRLLNLIIMNLILILLGINGIKFKDHSKLIIAILKSGWTINRKVNVWRNCMFKFAFIKLFAKAKGMNYLIDEGLSQIPYIFATSQFKLNNKWIFPYINDNSIIVEHLDVDIDEIKTRLIKRGHPLLDNVGIEQFMTFNLNVKEELKLLLNQVNN